MKRLWETGKLEDGVLACHVYRRFAKSCAACEFKLFERWIDRYVRNWAHCDGVGTFLVAACIANEPELRFALRQWTRSSNRWKRRAAAVSLIHEAKRGRHLEFILEIAGALLPNRDEMIEKGVGWLLKETYPARPRETVAFLTGPSGRAASRLTLRYAAEKMTAADRRLVLG
jgi:3-methyladenine DNA glycosylase AlkD